MKNVFTKRNIAIVIVILGVLGLVLIVYLQRGTAGTIDEQGFGNETFSNSPKVVKPDTQSLFPEIKSEYQIRAALPSGFSFPESLPVYKVENNTIEEKDFVQIATRLGFTTKPTKSTNFKGETIYSYYSGYKTMEVLVDQKVIYINSGIITKDSIAILPSKEEVINSVIAYLKKNRLMNDGETLELVHHELIAEGEHAEGPNSSAQNRAINAVFTKKIEGYPLIGAESQTGNVVVTLNSNLEIISLRMTYILQITKQDTYPLKNKDELLEKLGEATLLDLNIANPGELISKNISSITVNKVDIVYKEVKQKDQNQLQPFFLLQGTAFYNDRTTSPATLQLPAISEKYFQ